MTSPLMLQGEAALTGVIRFGIIGCGALGVVHALRLIELPNVEVTAVSDPDEKAMERLVNILRKKSIAYPISTHADYRDLLKTEGLTATCINSPNRWHVEQILASLEANLHVLCEKPLTMEPSEVTLVAEATEKSGKIVAIAYQSRYRRDSRALRQLLRSGKYGRVTSINIYSGEDWITPNKGTWRHDPARCPGGFFADANGHQLDVLFWMTGLEAATLRATIEKRGTPVPMFIFGEARLRKQGTSALEGEEPTTLTFTFVGDKRLWQEEIHIQTERADFVFRQTNLLWSDGTAGLAPVPDSLLDTVEDYDTPDTGFVKALRGVAPILSPPESVAPVLNFTLAALASAESGSATQEMG